MILVDQQGEEIDINPKPKRSLTHNYDEIDPDSSDNDIYNDADLNLDENHDRDFFSLPSLGLNYWNNLSLNLNLNLNLRNTSLWKIYENTSFPHIPRPGFPLNPLNRIRGVHDPLDLDVISQQVDSKTWFEWLNSLDFEHFLSPQALEAFEALVRITKPKEIETVTFDDSLSTNLSNEQQENEQDPGVESDCDIENEEFWSSFNTEVYTEKSSTAKPPLNPFYHRLNLKWYDKIKIGFCTLTLVPIRVLGIFLCLCLAWLMATIGMLGCTFEEVQANPLSTWRRRVRTVIARCVMRALFFFCGFHWVKVKGKQASRKDAPVLVVASHSTMFDAFPLIMMGAPGVVSKSSVRDIPFFGKLVDMTQPVYVSRENADSRKASKLEIHNRAQSPLEHWPQIFIFPEGTCTNRSCLITFKPGAFGPAVPVQPVLLKYPNRCDTITWTFDGISALQSFWLTIAQFHNYLEIEYLPVYNPTEEECKDVTLYANNVQQLMGKALGIPAIDFSFEDGRIMEKVRSSPLCQRLEKVWNLRLYVKVIPSLLKKKMRGPDEDWEITIDEFAATVDSTVDDPQLQCLFNLFDKEGKGKMNLREYILYVCLLHPSVLIERVVLVIFLMYGNARKSMSKNSFILFMQILFFMDDKEAEAVFLKGAKRSSDQSMIYMDEFKQAVRTRLEFAKLFAMEANGELAGEYPPRHVSIPSKPKQDSKTKQE